MVTAIQVGAAVAGLVSLAFFGLFSGYYFRNRRMAMKLRRSAAHVERTEVPGPQTGREYDGIEPPTA